MEEANADDIVDAYERGVQSGRKAGFVQGVVVIAGGAFALAVVSGLYSRRLEEQSEDVKSRHMPDVEAVD
jgi:hypothetical protein